MWFPSLLKRLTRGAEHAHEATVRRATRRPQAPPRRSVVLGLEALEDRTVPSTLSVSNTHDSGGGSLRAAIATASSGDTIVFDSTLSGHTIQLTSGELDVTRDLTIQGPGANQLTISGHDASRVFHISGSGTDVTIKGLTIANGRTGGGLGGGGVWNEEGATLTLDHTSLSNNRAFAGAGLDVVGGGLLNEGTATITASTFSGNQVLGGNAVDAIGGSSGGAICNFAGGNLILSGTAFTNNQAVGAAGPYYGMGGAIDNNAGINGDTPSSATITACLFTGNVATGGAGSTANGGAINNVYGSTMTIRSSLLARNQAIGGDGGDGVSTLSEGIGGGILTGAGATLDLIDSVVLGNEAVGGNNATRISDTPLGDSAGDGSGGGVENLYFGTLNVTNCTIAGNVARGGANAHGPGGHAFGGGLQDFGSATLTVTNSQIVGNLASAGDGGPGASTVLAARAAGGGIEVSGGNVFGPDAPSVATVIGCTISGNAAVGGAGSSSNRGGDGVGGGISVGTTARLGQGPAFPDNSSLTLIDSTVACNLALGGAGGRGANGGDGLGGGIWLYARSDTTATVTIEDTAVEDNNAIGGDKGKGGSAGAGIGGGVYNAGTFSFDVATVITRNQASTSNDNIFP